VRLDRLSVLGGVEEWLPYVFANVEGAILRVNESHFVVGLFFFFLFGHLVAVGVWKGYGPIYNLPTRHPPPDLYKGPGLIYAADGNSAVFLNVGQFLFYVVQPEKPTQRTERRP
jgi:hypothetical protein